MDYNYLIALLRKREGDIEYKKQQIGKRYGNNDELMQGCNNELEKINKIVKEVCLMADAEEEKENEELRYKVVQLENDKEDLENENSCLQDEIDSLEAEIDCLKETIDCYECEG